MGKKYNIKTLPSFANDLDEVIGYIINELSNPIAAEHLLIEMNSKLKTLSILPKIYKKYVPKIKRKYIYYKLKVKKYSMFYSIHGNTVILRRFLYSKRDFENLL